MSLQSDLPSWIAGWRARAAKFLACAAMAFTSHAAITISDVEVVNVTPSSFSVVWAVSEPGSQVLSVYADAAGTQSLTGQVGIQPQPLNTGNATVAAGYERRQNVRAIRTKTRAFGLMEVQVLGCEPDTTYYFRIQSKDGSGAETIHPASGPLPSVKTAVENSFVRDSRQLLITIPGNEVEGRIVLLDTDGASHPLAAVVGDGAEPNQVYFNLSDLFALVGGKNFVPIGDHSFDVEVLGPPISGGQSRYTLNFTTQFTVAATERQSLGREFFSLKLPSTILHAGLGGVVPINVDNSGGVASIRFSLNLPAARFGNIAIESLAPEIGNTSVQPQADGRVLITIAAAVGQTIQGKRDIANVKFDVLANQSSAFVPMRLEGLVALKPGNVGVNDLFGEAGRLVVIAAEPLLEARIVENRSRVLTLFGKAQVGYQLQVSSDLKSSVNWRNLARVPMASNVKDLTEIGFADPNSFYRAFELDANHPAIELARLPGGKGQLTAFGGAGTSYRVEGTQNLSGVVQWTKVLDFTLTTGFKTVGEVELTNPMNFYRIVKP